MAKSLMSEKSTIEKTTKKQKLTPKQEMFIARYMECGNAAEAYKSVYRAGKMKRETIKRNAFTLLHAPLVAEAIERERQELKAKAAISKEEILHHLENIIRSKISDFVDFDGWNLQFKPFKNLTSAQLEAIESVKEGKYGIELKLQGKSWSIERICKMLGYDEPEKKDITSCGQQIAIEIISDKSQAKNENDTDN